MPGRIRDMIGGSFVCAALFMIALFGAELIAGIAAWL